MYDIKNTIKECRRQKLVDKMVAIRTSKRSQSNQDDKKILCK